MGLDMYLNAKRYVCPYDHEPADRVLGEQIAGLIGITPGQHDLMRVTEVSIRVGYWRKANQIHNWFVQHVQEGKDECQDAYVSRDQLKELRALCQKVLDSCKLVKGTVTNGFRYTSGAGKQPILQDGQIIADPSLAEELLPNRSGFFFGSTDYDEYYINDLKATIQIIDGALAMPDKGWDFEYHSSW